MRGRTDATTLVVRRLSVRAANWKRTNVSIQGRNHSCVQKQVHASRSFLYWFPRSRNQFARKCKAKLYNVHHFIACTVLTIYIFNFSNYGNLYSSRSLDKGKANQPFIAWTVYNMFLNLLKKQLLKKNCRLWYTKELFSNLLLVIIQVAPVGLHTQIGTVLTIPVQHLSE